MWVAEFSKVLKSRTEEIQEKNPLVSERALARKVGMSSGSFSEILNGKRGVSLNRAITMLEKLDVASAKIEHIKKMAQEQPARVLLPADAQEVLTKWQNLAILSLMDLAQPPANEKEISKKLGLPEEDIQQSIELLIRNKLLFRHEDGQLSTTGNAWTTQDIPSTAGRTSHINGLELASKAIRQIPPTHRHVMALTFNGDPKALEWARKEIEKTYNRIAKTMGRGQKVSHVYRLSVQLFPVDQWDEFSN